MQSNFKMKCTPLLDPSFSSRRILLSQTLKPSEFFFRWLKIEITEFEVAGFFWKPKESVCTKRNVFDII